MSLSLLAQENKVIQDSIMVQNDTVKVDTIPPSIRKPAKGGIDSRITYKAVTLSKRDLINKKWVLVKDVEINYQDMVIKADSVVIDMNTNLLYAIGRPDTTGKVVGKPSFKQGSNAFESDELTYNFKTKKALIKNIVTQQSSGLLHSQYTKLLEDGTSNIMKSTYSTCNADTPHFYINLPKAKVYPGKKIISGPGNLVVEGVPLPLIIPFGYFPIQNKRAESGIIIPRYGEERVRGFSLTDGGYYFAISNYFDLQFKGSVYSNGSWLLNTQSDYRKLYKYNGSFAFSFADNKSGHKGLSDYSEQKNYSLRWQYSQDAKASPGSRFSASVAMSSSGYDKNNSYNVADHITTTRQSAISYSKSWDGTPFNLAVSANHSQNMATHVVSLDLPKGTFNVSRIYPFKSKNSTGKAKWYEDFQLSYSSSFDNQIQTTDSLLFTHAVWKNMKNGFKHDIPFSYQIRPFKNFSITPALTYSGVLYTRKIVEEWNPNYYDPTTNTTSAKVVNDTIRGVFYGQALNPSFSASYSPQIFGTYDFTEKSPNSRIQKIRHVIKPTIGFTFVPSIRGLATRKMYRQVQVDTAGTRSTYSIFANNIYGTPSLSSKSGNISFGLVNLLEAKVFEKNDTTEKPKKIKLIDNLTMGTSYNIFADKFRWAPVTMHLSTSIMNVKINLSGNFSLYGTDSLGNAVNKLLFTQNNKLMRLTNFSTSIDFSLSDFFKKDKKTGSGNQQNTGDNRGNQNLPGKGGAGESLKEGGTFDQYGYTVFDVPWNLSVSYNISYAKSGLKSVISHGISFNNGSVTLTKKMSATFSSGYDFKAQQITYTTVGISRDLHCWTMNLNWVPIGTTKGWNFMIRVKASVLGDLKYERRKDYHDSY